MEIDLVYTWVNSADVALAAQRAEYAVQEIQEDQGYCNGALRYRDNGELEYSVQTALRYLPFIRRIYIAYAGSPPAWAVGEGKIFLVPQQSLLPAGVGPTFQSDVIEAFLHRIPGLSERYLYSNDDFFFSKEHAPRDFFDEIGNCRIAVCARFAGLGGVKGPFQAAEVNSARALKQRLKLRRTVSVGSNSVSKALGHPQQRIKALRAGIPLLNTNTHVTQPYRKSSWIGFHALFANEIASLCSKKFRSKHGYAINTMYQHYLRSIGAAIFAYEPNHVFLDRSDSSTARTKVRNSLLKEQREISRFCLNDGPAADDDGWGQYIRSLMNGLGFSRSSSHARTA